MLRNRMALVMVAAAYGLGASGCAIGHEFQLWMFRPDWNSYRRPALTSEHRDHDGPTMLRTQLYRDDYNTGRGGVLFAPTPIKVPPVPEGVSNPSPVSPKPLPPPPVPPAEMEIPSPSEASRDTSANRDPFPSQRNVLPSNDRSAARPLGSRTLY